MICCLAGDPSSPAGRGRLEAVARGYSPRVTPVGPEAVMLDAAGLEGLFGSPQQLAASLSRAAAERGCVARVALAGTVASAWLLAHGAPGITIAAPGADAAALAGLPLELLSGLPAFGSPGAPSAAAGPERLALLHRWGLRTLGDLARLPRADLRTRLGAAGVRWHQAACGEALGPLVPAEEARRFVETVRPRVAAGRPRAAVVRVGAGVRAVVGDTGAGRSRRDSRDHALAPRHA